jgi:MFS family permease
MAKSKRGYLAFGMANILFLGFAALLNEVGSVMIMPILPMFLTSLGATGIIIGLIGGLRDSVSSLLMVFGGLWADKSGKRKPFVLLGYFNSAIFKLLLAFSRTWPIALIFASLERTGKGIRTAPRDAMIAELIPKRHGWGFGFHRTFDKAGAVAGAILVFLLFWFLGLSFKSLFIIAAFITFVSLAPVMFVREKKKKPKDVTLRLGLRKLPLKARLFIIIASLFAMANFSYMFFILRAQQFFTAELAIAIPILLFVVYNVFYAGFSIPFGALSDRIGREKVIGAGYGLFFVTCIGFAFATNITMLIVLFILYGLVFAAIEGNQRAFMSDLAPEHLEATALGTFHTAVGIIALPASLIAGFLWTIEPRFTFIFGGVIALIAAVLFYVIHGFNSR